jgi:hypothetical protein
MIEGGTLHGNVFAAPRPVTSPLARMVVKRITLAFRPTRILGLRSAGDVVEPHAVGGRVPANLATVERA